MLVEQLAEAYREFREAEDGVKSAEKAYEAAIAYLNSLNNVDVGILRNNLKKAQDDLKRLDASRKRSARLAAQRTRFLS